jgi:hypothetical protein
MFKTTATTSTISVTLAVILGTAAAAVTLALAVAPAWVPEQAHDGLRVVELPRVVITAQREQAAAVPVVELPRVVIVAKREPLPASETTTGASKPAHLVRMPGQAQPVMSRHPY